MIRTINVRNVNEALPIIINTWFNDSRLLRDISPRGKRTLEIKGTVATCYSHPSERVLFCPVRDANPFLHLFDALWVLAGRNDVGFMARLRSTMAEYSDDGMTFHGAYGLRLARGSQLSHAIAQLRDDRDSRRAVLALWQPDLDAGYTGRDMPCNTTIALKVRDDALNITVFNRSNDAVWGAYGANVVQFSMLQEFIAMHLGVGIGTYTQVSDSLHIYPEVPVVQALLKHGASYNDPYDQHREDPAIEMPFTWEGATAEQWVHDLYAFFHVVDAGGEVPDYKTEWWTSLGQPMWDAFCHYKSGDIKSAIGVLDGAAHCDWTMAARAWLLRRGAK